MAEATGEQMERVYVVQKILSCRRHGGQTEYLLKWQGFPDSANSWETEDSLNCPQLLEEFQERQEKERKRRSLACAKKRIARFKSLASSTPRTSDPPVRKARSTNNSNANEASVPPSSDTSLPLSSDAVPVVSSSTAVALRSKAIAFKSRAIALRSKAIASRSKTMASNSEPVASSSKSSNTTMAKSLPLRSKVEIEKILGCVKKDGQEPMLLVQYRGQKLANNESLYKVHDRYPRMVLDFLVDRMRPF